LKVEVHTLKEPECQIVKHHLQAIGKLRIQVGVHPKMIAVARTVVETVATGEKVLLFCHHHATAQELSIRLDAEIPKLADYGRLRRDAWITAWTELLEDRAFHENHHPTLLKVFVEWLCADLIRSQTHGWFKVPPSSIAKLKDALLVTKGRSVLGSETVFNAACRLYDAMLRSNSARAVLKRAEGAKEEQLLPGSNGTSRVLGVCESIGDSRFNRLFIHNTQPDTVIAIFNSPFGPDVLVATDKLSEGVDLHRYCRHLIHYELDPSPIRTVQRNGRLRRVECWAAVTKQPIMFAYPAFAGTRDQKLAQIMKKRISSFSLLLGGVQDIDLEEVLGEDEDWRSRVIELAKGSLSKLNGKLAAKIAS
jgi:ERCC4-related helicase